MMEASIPVPDLELLIRHRSFVRQIARGMLGDSAAAEDVAQDALVAGWRTPIPEERAARGWFATIARNLSRNRMRAAARRASRERAAATAEYAPESNALERAETSQKIVRLVLELEEPYRRVVLMRYFDDLSPQQVATRLALPEGTVRSQLHRAHDELRRRLEPEFGSSRRFALALFGLAEVPARAMAVPASAVVATSLVIVGGAAWYALSAGSTPIAENPVVPAKSVASASGASEPPVVAHAEPVTRVATEVAEVAESNVAATVDGLLGDARAIQAALRAALLVPKPEFESLASRWGEDGGVARILGRDVWEFELREPLTIRGGGAYFSFETRSHSYDHEPDLEFEGDGNGYFSTSFYGGTEGFLRSLGDLPLEALSADPQSPPPAVDSSIGAIWSAMLSPIDCDEHRRVQVPDPLARVSDRAKAELGSTYVLRAILPGEHDHAVAFRTVDRDQHGYTLVFRILKRFPMEKTRNRPAPTPLSHEVAPGLRGLSVKDLLARLTNLRRNGDASLLSVTDEEIAQTQAIANDASARVSKILPRGRYGAITSPREGGAYLSFTTGSNDYDEQPTIDYQNDTFGSGFYGGTVGVVVDLGAVSLRDGESIVRGDSMTSRLFDLDLSNIPVKDRSSFLRNELSRFGRPEWIYAAKAEVGHTYLVRKASDHDDEPSVLGFFQFVARDEHGAATLAWRVVRTDGI